MLPLLYILPRSQLVRVEVVHPGRVVSVGVGTDGEIEGVQAPIRREHSEPESGVGQGVDVTTGEHVQVVHPERALATEVGVGEGVVVTTIVEHVQVVHPETTRGTSVGVGQGVAIQVRKIEELRIDAVLQALASKAGEIPVLV